MYLDKAVMIPKRKGISFKSKGDTNYVIYEIGDQCKSLWADAVEKRT